MPISRELYTSFVINAKAMAIIGGTNDQIVCSKRVTSIYFYVLGFIKTEFRRFVLNAAKRQISLCTAVKILSAALPAPVSYTHLDVYKRQIFEYAHSLNYIVFFMQVTMPVKE